MPPTCGHAGHSASGAHSQADSAKPRAWDIRAPERTPIFQTSQPQVLTKLGSPGENEPGPAVDKFAHGVKVPGMSGSLGDHMHDDRVQIV